jgi:hypothetical protein
VPYYQVVDKIEQHIQVSLLNKMSEGYIYCLTNEAMPGLVKIGEIHTEGRTPEDRIRELYTTGVPFPFTIEFAKRVKNPAQAEARIHAFLNDKRLNPRREFFKTTPEVVSKLFDLIDGEMWVPTDDDETNETTSNTNTISKMNQVFTEGLLIRHIVGSDLNKTWIGKYNAITDRIVYDGVSYASPSDFALKHHRVYYPDRKSAGGWAECDCQVNGEWITAGTLRA